MSYFQNEMNRVVQGFVAQIGELARRAAVDTLESAFGSQVPRAGVARGGRPEASRSAKRTSEDIEATAEKFASFVTTNPGLRIEQINKQLGTETKDLALPIRKLISDGVVSTKGQKRSTTYFPGKKAAKN